ncbi:MAG TPA: acetyl-CoA C-acyltransferase [Jiangellaceae bacterium]|nr:acetyl-CoA C-acyltransferase [Jiangellaceae bacterium]
MSTAVPVLLDGRRTPFGRFRGSLRRWPTRELLAHPIRALSAAHPHLEVPDGVLLGQVLQAGHGQNPARLAAADGGIPWTVPAVTLNNVCLAGLETLCAASRRIQLDEGSAYLVGGGDSMTRAAHAGLLRPDLGLGSAELVDTMIVDGLHCGLTNEGMGDLSDQASAELGVSREAQDAIALGSQERAARAMANGWLAEEIVELEDLSADEGIRPSTTADGLRELRPSFSAEGTITAGNASQMSDGATVGFVTSLDEADRLRTEPLAHIVAHAEVAGPDNTLHRKPASAIRAVCERAKIELSDIDLIEINEAFAGVVAASVDDLAVPMDIVNVNGGAIAVGHPLGGTGLRLVLTLAHELRRRGLRRGVAALCGGGGQGLAVLIENAREA